MSNLIYQVLIIRRDGTHIMAFETKDFEESKQRWRSLTDNWLKSLKEETTFELEEPIITAFDPGLIQEVTIAPVEEQSKETNPYKANTQQNGLGTSLQNFTGGMNGLTDSGYR